MCLFKESCGELPSFERIVDYQEHMLKPNRELVWIFRTKKK